ncbi:hypothetical protein AAZX31_13G076100 [Glycine max]
MTSSSSCLSTVPIQFWIGLEPWCTKGLILLLLALVHGQQELQFRMHEASFNLACFNVVYGNSRCLQKASRGIFPFVCHQKQVWCREELFGFQPLLWGEGMVFMDFDSKMCAFDLIEEGGVI